MKGDAQAEVHRVSLSLTDMRGLSHMVAVFSEISENLGLSLFSLKGEPDFLGKHLKAKSSKQNVLEHLNAPPQSPGPITW